MITALFCWLFGHKYVVYGFTKEIVGIRYVHDYQQKPFCVRCGHPNPYYPKPVDVAKRLNLN